MTANTPTSRKGKGREFQKDIRADLIKSLGIEEGDILSTTMGQGGCDLYLSPAAREKFPFGVEAKRQERISLPEWWEQCTRNAEAEGLAPLLVLKQNRKEALAVLRWEDLLALLCDRQTAEAALALSIEQTIEREDRIRDLEEDALPLGRDYHE